MTALTAQAAHARRQHRVPWRSMARATWLQHRALLITLLAAWIALAAAIVAGDLHIQATYARFAAEGCVVRPIHAPCGTIANTIAAGTDGFTVLVIALHVLPILVGVFAGAPLLSREFESGTFRFTWTQGIGRTRFVLITAALLAAAVTAAACTLGVLVSWYAHPFDVVGVQSQWQSGLFDTTPLVLSTWTLLALIAGIFLGTLTGRVVPAMAATAACAGGLLLAAFWELDHHLLGLGALTTRVTPAGGLFLGLLNRSAIPGLGPAGSWLVRGWVTGPGGHQLSNAAANNLENRMYAATSKAGSNNPAAWLSLHHYRYWLSYQPADHFWYFQATAGAVLIALATLFAAMTIWLIRRRG